MSVNLDVYKCEICGLMVEVVHGAKCSLTCCGREMARLKENTTDAAKEKHVPVIEEIDGGYKVSVGSVLHPMTEEHRIEWIELIADGKAYRQFLEPGQDPIATFEVKADTICAREFCNLHGLWKA